MALVTRHPDGFSRSPNSLLGILASFRGEKALEIGDSGALCIATNRGKLAVKNGVVAITDSEGAQLKVITGFKGKIICKAVEALFDNFEKRQSQLLFGDLQRSVTQFKEFEGLSWESGDKVSIESKIGHLRIVAFPSKYDNRDTSWSVKVVGFRGKEVSRLVLPYDSPLDYYFGSKYQDVQLRRLESPQGIVIDYDKAYREALTPPQIVQKKSRPTGLVSFLKDVKFIQLHKNGDDQWIIGSKNPSFFDSPIRITADGNHCLFENEVGSHRVGRLTSRAVFRYLKAKAGEGIYLEQIAHPEAA